MKPQSRAALGLVLVLGLPAVSTTAAAQSAPTSEVPQPLPSAPRTLASWGEAFQAIHCASPRYRIAAAEIAAARGRARVALADLLPHAEAQGSFTHELFVDELDFGMGPVSVPAQDVWSAGVTVNMAVLDARALHAYGTAQRAVAASERDLAAERRALAEVLSDALLTAWTAERLAELHRTGLSAALDRLALTENKAALGRATTLDIDRARQDVESARDATLHGDDALWRARASLGQLLGAPVALAAPRASDAQGLARSLRAWCTPNDAIAQVPEVAAAEQHLEVAERELDGLDLELLPQLMVQSQLRWDSETVYGPDATVQLGVVLRAPIWDGGARYGRKREARALRLQAQLRLEQARSDARLNVSEAARAIELATQALRIGSSQRELARRIDRGTRLAFEQGVGTSFDLIAAAQALRQAELNALLLTAELVRAEVRATLSNAACHF